MQSQTPETLVTVLDELLADKENSLSAIMTGLVKSVRTRLQMEVAFVAEFISGRRVFRYVDSIDEVQIVKVGGSDPLDKSFCQRIADGQLPELIKNAQEHPGALELPVTCYLPVGAHISVPIRLSSGRVYGTFCTFSRKARSDLNARHLAMIRVFADIAGALIEKNFETLESTRKIHETIRSIIDQDKLVLFGQPIVDLQGGGIIAVELLSRVVDDQQMRPDILFEDAQKIGLANELGMRTIERTFDTLKLLPANLFASLNLTPEIILKEDLVAHFENRPLDRIVIEITEHSKISDYQAFNNKLAPLRSRGLRLAIDDAGAGYASLHHVLQLQPDIIKLDISLIRAIHVDCGRQALAKALIEFARCQKYQLIAEGIETAEELDMLRSLGVRLGQGFYFAKPQPVTNFF